MKQLLLILSLIIFIEQVQANNHSFDKLDGLEQIDIDELFIIEEGFDTNDNIEITVHGVLPNGCHKLKDISIKKSNENTYDVKAYIKRKNLSGCINNQLSTPVNFTKTISLGELPVGKYAFQYEKNDTVEIKHMMVKRSNVATIDDNLYAPISNAFIPELIYTTKNAQVILTGIFYSNCYSLKSTDMEIIRKKNIFIILPKISLNNNGKCTYKKYPIQQVINLGPIREVGHYLVHIRSLSGLSINKAFFVEKKTIADRNSL